MSAYEEAVTRALGSLTSDVAWRVHFTAVLFLHRVLILVREATFVNVGAFHHLHLQPGILEYLLVSELRLWRLMLQHLTHCLALCSESLVWKILIILGRFAAMEGDAASARAVAVASLLHA